MISGKERWPRRGIFTVPLQGAQLTPGPESWDLGGVFRAAQLTRRPVEIVLFFPSLITVVTCRVSRMCLQLLTRGAASADRPLQGDSGPRYSGLDLVPERFRLQ